MKNWQFVMLAAFALQVMGCGLSDVFETSPWTPPKADEKSRVISVCLDQSSSMPRTIQREQLEQTRSWLRETADPISRIRATDRKGVPTPVDMEALRKSVASATGDPAPTVRLSEAEGVRLYIRSVGANDLAQELLTSHLVVPYVGPKGWRPRETEQETDHTRLYPAHLTAWLASLSAASNNSRDVSQALDRLVVPTKPALDSDYFSCIAAALRDLQQDGSRKHLIVAGDFILDANQDDIPPAQFEGIDVVMYSDCTRSTVFEANGHLFGTPRNAHCQQVEARWTTCFAAWGAKSLTIARHGDPNPLADERRGIVPAGDCKIRDEIPASRPK